MDAITWAISSLHEKLLLHEDMQAHFLPVLGQSVPPIPGTAEPHAGQAACRQAVTQMQHSDGLGCG